MAIGNTYDPLAQTFKVDETGGCFITSVDLFFAVKDNNLPVWVEIRTVVNGYPGAKLLPFGRKVLEPGSINLDPITGATATTFTFDAPVYVQEGEEYCVVVMTSSLDYRVWIAQTGEVDVGGTSRVVSRQPVLGVLFKSSNNSAWTPVQMQDLKFTLNKARFSTNNGNVTLNNGFIGDAVTTEDGSTVAYGRRLLPNPLNLTHNTAAVLVKHKDHGMYSTSNNVTITGAISGVSTTLNGAITATSTSLTLTSATGFEASNLSSRCYVKINNEIMFGTLSSTTIGSLTRAEDGTTAAAHSNGATVELYQVNKTPLDQINKTHTAIANIGMDSYTFTVSNAPTVTGADGTPVVQVGGTGVYVTENYRFETMRTSIATLELSDTFMIGKVGTTTGTSPSGTETSFQKLSAAEKRFHLNENFDFDTTKIIASTPNETNEMSGSKSLSIPITMGTSNQNLSPIIDMDRASMICIGNVFNSIDSSSDVYPTTDFRASTEVDGDNNAAVYITKKIALENPATSIRVVFAANKLNTADIEVLFKTLRSDDAFDFDEVGYTFFNTDGSPDSTVNTSLERDDFQDYTYSAGITDDGIGEPLPEFIQFAIKIVMKGTNAAQPPRIKDLRVIALAT
jgi:hypothetical protein